MFCSKCGNVIEENQNFCSKCGNKISSAPSEEAITDSPQSQIDTQPNKTNIKKILIRFGKIIGLILVVCIIFNIISNIIPKRVDFDLKYDRAEIQKFMDIVCDNANVEYAQVGRVDIENYCSVQLTVKPHGMVSEKIEVRFYNKADTDDVSGITVYYYEYDSENEITCRDAIVEALEISFCGSSKAKEYTDKFSSIRKDVTSYRDSQIIASYSLTSEANVRISYSGKMGTFYIFRTRRW